MCDDPKPFTAPGSSEPACNDSPIPILFLLDRHSLIKSVLAIESRGARSISDTLVAFGDRQASFGSSGTGTVGASNSGSIPVTWAVDLDPDFAQSSPRVERSSGMIADHAAAS